MTRRLRSPGAGPARAALLLAALVSLAAPEARAEQRRFDLISFRPSGMPQDLVFVTQSRPMSHLSASVGLFASYALSPLQLVRASSGEQQLSIVSNRLELHAMAAIGLFDWVEIGLSLPIILFQNGANLSDVGTEGSVQGSALGDLRFSAKIAVPGLRRKAEGKGFGLSLVAQLAVPTGALAAFASDGRVTFAPGLVFDYRFGFGMLITLNAGLWLRPKHAWSSIQIGDMVPLAAGVEVPLIRRWGLTVIGGAYANLSIHKLPTSAREVPAEALFGFRWYGKAGFTLTVGGGAGLDCSFGNPSLRVFAALVWVPSRTREWAALERFKIPPEDPDGDGLIGDKDKCPDKVGPVENHGCPDADRDRDGIIDRLDQCPDEPGRKGRPDGCPMVRIKGDKIVILEPVHFATDLDIILPESFPILDDVAGLLAVHPEIEQVLVEGHTDIRASDAYNLDLSDRRAHSVMMFLVGRGVEPVRLRAQGFGRRRPVASNTTEAGMAQNRRVEFTIEKRTTVDERSRLPGGQLPDSAPLPGEEGALPRSHLPGGDLPAAPAMPAGALPESQLPGGELGPGGQLTPSPGGQLEERGTLPEGTLVPAPVPVPPPPPLLPPPSAPEPAPRSPAGSGADVSPPPTAPLPTGRLGSLPAPPDRAPPPATGLPSGNLGKPPPGPERKPPSGTLEGPALAPAKPSPKRPPPARGPAPRAAPQQPEQPTPAKPAP